MVVSTVILDKTVNTSFNAFFVLVSLVVFICNFRITEKHDCNISLTTSQNILRSSAIVLIYIGRTIVYAINSQTMQM